MSIMGLPYIRSSYHFLGVTGSKLMLAGGDNRSGSGIFEMPRILKLGSSCF